VEEENVIVSASKAALSTTKRTMPMVDINQEEDSRVFLIVGGGPAGLECAESLRQEGYKGRIVMATREDVLPYDRPKLSKAMSVKAQDISLRPEGFYKEHAIEVQFNKEASGLNVPEKTVSFTDESSLKYDKVFLATGSIPRKIPVPGVELENVFLLRDPANANAINAAAEGKRVVLVGTGFIGMEVAAFLSSKAASVTCVDLLKVPFEPILGPTVGETIQKFQEEKGVKFKLGVGLKEFVGTDGKLTGVKINTDEVIEADVAVMGIGVVPCTSYLKESALELSRRGEVVVDETMKAGEDVYAGGDIVRFPLPLIGDTANIGHWQIAHKHGRVAAKNMVGKKTAFDGIPFFWSLLLGKGIRFCGHSANWDELVTHGNLEEYKFVVHFIKGDKVTAVCTIGTNAAVVAAELMYQGKMLSADEIRSNPGALVDM
jgi:NAD(P)H-nitrite reductase large subunit